jgi:hypothetical protein
VKRIPEFNHLVENLEVDDKHGFFYQHLLSALNKWAKENDYTVEEKNGSISMDEKTGVSTQNIMLIKKIRRYPVDIFYANLSSLIIKIKIHSQNQYNDNNQIESHNLLFEINGYLMTDVEDAWFTAAIIQFINRLIEKFIVSIYFFQHEQNVIDDSYSLRDSIKKCLDPNFKPTTTLKQKVKVQKTNFFMKVFDKNAPNIERAKSGVMLGLIISFMLFFFKSFVVIGLLVLAEIISCYYLRQVPVKGWIEILSFLTIICSIKYGFIFAFWFFIISYILSMIGRQVFYPVELPYMFARALILGWIPTLMTESGLTLIVVVTMVVQRAILWPILKYISGTQTIRLIYESLFNILITMALVPTLGKFLLWLL